METDILIYAIIAVVIFARLWSLLGQKNGDEPERPNPFATHSPQKGRDDNDEPFAQTSSANALPAPPTALPAPRAAPASLAGGLEKIRELDSSFDEKSFLQGARAAFLMIVEDFLKGDLSRCERLLSPAVRNNFQAAIDARTAQGQIIENKSLKVKDAECVAAKVENKIARITVQFVSEQDNRMRQSSDGKEEPTPDSSHQTEEITDLWTFTRDTASQDPNWALSETRS